MSNERGRTQFRMSYVATYDIYVAGKRKQTDKQTRKRSHHRDTTDVQPMDVLVMYQLFYLENQLTQTKKGRRGREGRTSARSLWACVSRASRSDSCICAMRAAFAPMVEQVWGWSRGLYIYTGFELAYRYRVGVGAEGWSRGGGGT